jgi:hypothetical protein
MSNGVCVFRSRGYLNVPTSGMYEKARVRVEVGIPGTAMAPGTVEFSRYFPRVFVLSGGGKIMDVSPAPKGEICTGISSMISVSINVNI